MWELAQPIRAASVSKVIETSCCTSQPTPCPKSPPQITTSSLQPTPAFPLVLGQDPGRAGIGVPVVAVTAGEHDCRSATISEIEFKVRLSEESISWIRGELARRYPGARVLGTYPIVPIPDINGLNTSRVIASFHFDPLDPGDYEIRVTATQDDGQVVFEDFSMHVELFESTLTR